MRFVKVIIPVIITVLVLSFDKSVFSRGLFNVFTDTVYSDDGLRKAEEFDPDRDIFYLPNYDHDRDLFAAINDLSIFREVSVRRHLYLYLTSGREYVKRSIIRSDYYMDIIVSVFRNNRDIPPELALLPILESGFQPEAVSRRSAVGLWQFMRPTALYLDLSIDQTVDERRHIEKSTEAAIRHLRNLKNIFGSWELALAAYNAGGGYISRLMRDTGAENYWELRESGRLYRETYDYVPKFIALVLIYKNLELFGLSDELQDRKESKTVVMEFESPVDIVELSAEIGISLDKIRRYNPELNGTLTPSSVPVYGLRVPAQRGRNPFLRVDTAQK